MLKRKIICVISYCNRIVNVNLNMSSCFVSMPWSFVCPWNINDDIGQLILMGIQFSDLKKMYIEITLIWEEQSQLEVKHILIRTWPPLLLSLNPCLFGLKQNINLIDNRPVFHTVFIGILTSYMVMQNLGHIQFHMNVEIFRFWISIIFLNFNSNF